MVAVTGVWMNQISIFLLILPLYMLGLGLFAIGIGWIVSSLHVFVRDTAQILGVVMLVWFWLTPLFMAESTFPSGARFLLTVNPMFYVVRAYRAVLLQSAMPSLGDLGITVASGVVAFAIGGLFFRYMKRGFADVL
jgi:ABC-type polysaccharide/polyol phosphate export permease